MKRACAWEDDQKAYDLRAQTIVIDVGQCNLYGWRAIVSTTNAMGSGSPSYSSLTHPPTLLTTTYRICLCPLEWTWTAKSATSILTQLL